MRAAVSVRPDLKEHKELSLELHKSTLALLNEWRGKDYPPIDLPRLLDVLDAIETLYDLPKTTWSKLY